MNPLHSLHSLCIAKVQSTENCQKQAALHSLHSDLIAKPSKTLGFPRFAALHSLHSLKGGAWAVQSPAPLPLGARITPSERTEHG